MITLSIRKALHGADGPINLTIDTTIKNGEIVTLYGPTGSGKSSVLRMIAGLMTPDDGSITTNDQVWFDTTKRINLPSQQRQLGMVFQEYSLFPNMTVRGNLEFALDRGSDQTIIERLLDVAGLKNLQDKKPGLLSGGQKQRVALARALVRKPRLLLLDEPLSALDTAMRANLQTFIVQFHQEFDLTTILVSHDLGEVMKMSKRVLVISGGQIETDGDPTALLA